MKTEIKTTPAEQQSNFNRQQWAEKLIEQLPRNHDGAESWLINYGHGPLSATLRQIWEERNGKKLVYSEDHQAWLIA